jgi:hypothetical protein
MRALGAPFQNSPKGNKWNATFKPRGHTNSNSNKDFSFTLSHLLIQMLNYIYIVTVHLRCVEE